MCAVPSLASKYLDALHHASTPIVDDLKDDANNEYKEEVELETKNRFDRHDIKIDLGARNGPWRYEGQKFEDPATSTVKRPGRLGAWISFET